MLPHSSLKDQLCAVGSSGGELGWQAISEPRRLWVSPRHRTLSFLQGWSLVLLHCEDNCALVLPFGNKQAHNLFWIVQELTVKRLWIWPGVVEHTFSPRTQEAEAGRALWTRSAWSTRVLGLHNEMKHCLRRQTHAHTHTYTDTPTHHFKSNTENLKGWNF